MNSPFSASIRRKSAQQLINMISGENNWTDSQLKELLEELDNRGIDSDEVTALRNRLEGKDISEELISGDEEFMNDLSIIHQEEVKEKEVNNLRKMALIGGTVCSSIMLLIIIGLALITVVQDEVITSLLYAFFDFGIFFIVVFLAIWAFFVARWYLVSFITSCLFFVLLMIATALEHSTLT